MFHVEQLYPAEGRLDNKGVGNEAEQTGYRPTTLPIRRD